MRHQSLEQAEIADAENQTARSKLVLLSTVTGSQGRPRVIDPDARIRSDLRFVPDGKALAYPIRDKGVDNIWAQPLDGTPGRQITHFTSGHIGDFHRSPDGAILAIEHEEESATLFFCEKG
jgi:Tol biopolymer transport system component